MNRPDFFDPPDFAGRYVCSVAAAIIGAGALGAGASIYSSSRAASAQTKSAAMATQAQRDMFDVTRNSLQPFINAGQGGIGDLQKWLSSSDEGGPLNALMKLTMPGANMSETLRQTPGYQFAEDRGLRGVNNALAARGLGGSGGAVAKGAAEYTTGLASNTWQSVVNALQSLFTGGAAAKQNFVNTGANAAAGLGSNATQVGGQIGGNIIGAGNAQAGNFMNMGNALGNFGNNISQAAIFNKLFGNNNQNNNNSNNSLYGPDYDPAYNAT